MPCSAAPPLADYIVSLFAPGLTPATFRSRAAQILREAMDCQQVSFVSFDPRTRRLEVVFDPFFPEMAAGLEGFGRHMAEYPCFNCDPTVNGGQPFFRGDFLSDEEFYQSAVYQEGFKIAGISDHAAMLLPSEDETVFFLALEKRDGTTFNRSWRCRMEALQPHLGNARLLAKALVTPSLSETLLESEVFEQQGLSKRQAGVLALLSIGKTNSEIALVLGISIPTVKGHVTAIFDKLGVDNRHAAILRAHGIVRPPTPADDPVHERATTQVDPRE